MKPARFRARIDAKLRAGRGNAMTAKMLLHWSPRSPYVRKVMIVAHEAGLADRIDTVRTVVAAADAERRADEGKSAEPAADPAARRRHARSTTRA